MTRPLDQSERFAAEVRALWGGPLNVIYAPLIEIVPVAATLEVPDNVIFTSVNGVTSANQFDLPTGLTAWCVGRKTAQAAEAAGFAPITGPGDAEGLVAHIIAAQPLGTFAHIRGTHARGDVAATLANAGLPCADVVAYDQRSRTLTAAAQTALAGKSPVIVPLFSPRTGMIFAKQGPYQAVVHAPVISAAVQQQVEPYLAVRFELAARPDANAMLDATVAAIRAAGASI